MITCALVWVSISNISMIGYCLYEGLKRPVTKRDRSM